ncbi:FtsX-like permease family protein [bacterium A37T11]|nr:FtsX-like permease family protein [bacterium A37T11]
MIKNNLKTAWRNFRNNKLFGILNVLGLSLGLCVAILLALFIIQERSFDQLPNRDRIFRFVAHITYGGSNMNYAGVPNAVGPTIKEDRPEVRFAARTLLNDFGQNANINVGQDSYLEGRLYWADPEIIDIFDLHLLQGDPKTALKEPNSILLSLSKAKQYFGNKNPIHQTIKLDREKTLNVTGVYADLPKTSTFDADLIGSYNSTNFAKRSDSWNNASFETWVELNKPSDVPIIAAYLPKMVNKHVDKENQYYTLSLQPLADVHLRSSDILSYSTRKGDGTQFQQLAVLGLALILMAAINYMNLATARAQQRAKEVGVSKTLGASRSSLIWKFYTETSLLTLISIALGLISAIVAIPMFNVLSGKELLYSTLMHPLFWSGIPTIWILLTFLAGIYPALALSSYTPLQALQKGRGARSAKAFLRESLVVLQFAASITLIIGVVIMYRQMEYVSRIKLGYHPENVMAIGLSAIETDAEMDALKNQVSQLSETSGVVISQAFPGKGESGNSLHKDQSDLKGIFLKTNRVLGGNAQHVLQLKLLAGRMIKDRVAGDSLVEVVLNKYAVDYLGMTPEEAIGKKVIAGISDHSYIVGVVDNFNYASLHEPIGAYAFNNAEESLRYLLVRFRTGDLKKTIPIYEQAFKKVIPDAPFDYTFLDSNLKSLYLADQQTAAVMLAFSMLAIVVGCLGLFGLAAFMAEKRTKEIGVRKVLGATVPSLVRLLSVDFAKLVAIAFVIACPVAYWGFNKWLNNFAYRIRIEWWMFAAAGVGAVVIALATVSFQAVRAALVNPVDSLRDE